MPPMDAAALLSRKKSNPSLSPLARSFSLNTTFPYAGVLVPLPPSLLPDSLRLWFASELPPPPHLITHLSPASRVDCERTALLIYPETALLMKAKLPPVDELSLGQLTTPEQQQCVPLSSWTISRVGGRRRCSPRLCCRVTRWGVAAAGSGCAPGSRPSCWGGTSRTASAWRPVGA